MKYYLDIAPSKRGPHVARLFGRVLLCLHTKAPLSSMAIDFPRMKMGQNAHPGDLLRIWGDRDMLFRIPGLLTELASDLNIEQVNQLPESWSGKWVELKRFRLKPRRQKDPNTTRIAACARRRAASLEKAKSLPYLTMYSLSNKNYFRIFMERIVHDERVGGDVADSYGLSQSRNRISVPMLEG